VKCSDTSPKAKRFYFERLARMSPSERLALMRQSTNMIRQLAEAAVRSEHLRATPDEFECSHRGSAVRAKSC
jgi:hypothetical protein